MVLWDSRYVCDSTIPFFDIGENMKRDFINEEKKTDSYRDIMEFLEYLKTNGVAIGRITKENYNGVQLETLLFDECRELALKFNSLPEWKVIEKRTQEALDRQIEANKRNKK